jgi:hypothetical protein
MIRSPRVAVLLDENTSGDSTRYEASKAYFRAVAEAGGLPYGVPYIDALISPTLAEFDAFLAVGGGFAYPAAFYIADTQSPYRTSERYGFWPVCMAPNCMAMCRRLSQHPCRTIRATSHIPCRSWPARLCMRRPTLTHSR